MSTHGLGGDRITDWIVDNEGKAVTLVLVGSIVLGVTLWIGASFMEARTYNRLTGSNVSTVDAMFVKLRVSDAPKSAE